MLGYGTPSVVQLALVAFLLAYAWTVRKMNRAAITIAAAAIALLHMYDHLYRIKRGEERLFLLPQEQTETFLMQAEPNNFLTRKQINNNDAERIARKVREFR